MIKASTSLRARLMVLTLIPLTVISLLAGYWRISIAKETTQEIFDRTLIALTLAISRDVVVSGGDALSASTTKLIRDTFGGKVFYHVYGPDGAFVTGYATPPLMPKALTLSSDVPVLFESDYRGVAVRVARLREHNSFGPVTGFSAITVWQTMSGREAFLRQLTIRTIALIVALFLTVAAVVWFGIQLGLKPLIDLQEAISRRTSDDLSEIRRPIPPEVTGIVATLNTLFGQVSAAMASRDRFISDAAHQLRNPVAGILSLAEAARDASNPDDRASRTHEVVMAARHASRLTNQLLSLERAKGQTDKSRFRRVDANDVVRDVCERNADRILERGIDFSFQPCDHTLEINANEVMVQEAIQNLIDNALLHGGADNTEIAVEVFSRGPMAAIRVSDQGIGLSVQDSETAFSRFGQVGQSEGSGLGLAIVAEIAERHDGKAAIEPLVNGTGVSILIPVAEAMRE